MRRCIKQVATGLLLTGLLLTTGGFGVRNSEAAGNSEAAAVQSALSLLLLNGLSATETTLNYPIVDTGVSTYYSNNSLLTSAPATGEAFYGQDAHCNGNQPSYTDNGDGTVTDNVTGLMWQQDMGSKMTWSDANAQPSSLSLGGHTDWRLPTIKELYSLILFTGAKGDGNDPDTYTLFIDTDYFIQPFGDTANTEERIIDAQTWSATEYVGTTMGGDATVFGVNFIDGRIKGYPKYNPPANTASEGTAYFRFVRGNTDYGTNNFVDNENGTVSDLATGLMWQQADDGTARDWENALAYAEGLELAGHDDWRLPNAKELQSIVDYTRSPDVTGSAAIDPLFFTTEIEDPDGKSQYPYFWTGTTHIDSYAPVVYDKAVYIAFGEAQGKMEPDYVLYDVHGAGAQRSDPKSGDSGDFPDYMGPQGDVRYMMNYVRCVRDIN
ncbi:hypothetical protein VU01_10499 [Candidatus Electrothrix marina]|uniref:Lcl C-terminal domain-containing protein n=1 Tax=Candidatus Electrothrix marina TaxID=1859130 RepID=A0A444JFZ1_9BACT|nr:hypothetical protein VU01_10499 [Candidatus Electrothrix marina]